MNYIVITDKNYDITRDIDPYVLGTKYCVCEKDGYYDSGNFTIPNDEIDTFVDYMRSVDILISKDIIDSILVEKVGKEKIHVIRY